MESRLFKVSTTTSIHAQVTTPVSHGTSKPLLVFLHYWGGASTTWNKLTGSESPTSLVANYPTLAVDLRGWGNSTGPLQDNGSEYSATAMASDIVHILDDLAINSRFGGLLNHGFVLVGHSMGAKVAMAALANLSSSLLNVAKGIVLIAPSPATALQLPAELKEQQQSAYTSEDSIRWTLGNILSDFNKLDQVDIKSTIKSSLSGNQSAKKAWPGYGMQEDISSTVKAALENLVSYYPDFKAVVLAGEYDIVEPKEKIQAEVVQLFIDGGIQTSFNIIKGAKHLLPLEVPSAVQEAIRQF